MKLWCTFYKNQKRFLIKTQAWAFVIYFIDSIKHYNFLEGRASFYNNMSKRKGVEERKGNKAPAKRQATDSGEGLLWKIVFPSPSSFKNMIKIVAGVLSEANVQLVKTEEFQGLLIESLHPSQVCLIIASYAQTIQCAPDLNLENHKFKLQTNVLKRFWMKWI